MNMKGQAGSTLLVSLIILLVLTIVGVSSVGNISLNQKMATSYRDADVAFQAAEAALAEGEAAADLLSASLSETSFESACTGSDCFTAACNGGKCFNGAYEFSSLDPCTLDEPSTPVYRDLTTWSDSSRHFVSQLNFPELSEQPKYIIEFLCYVQSDTSAPVPSPAPPPYAVDDWSFFYRITAHSRGVSDASRVVLQSTYKVRRD